VSWLERVELIEIINFLYRKQYIKYC